MEGNLAVPTCAQTHRRWALTVAAAALVLVLGTHQYPRRLPQLRRLQTAVLAEGPTNFTAKLSSEHLSVDGRMPPVVPAVRKGLAFKKRESWWMAQHKRFVKEVTALQRDEALELLFYGDSITARWRVWQAGLAVEMFEGILAEEVEAEPPADGHKIEGLAPQEKKEEIPATFNRHYGRLRAGVLSLPGDTSRVLLWRLLNGEGPAALRPEVAVVLIGTNDLASLEYDLDLANALASSAFVAAGVAACVAEILSASPATHVVLLGILPRIDRHRLSLAAPAKYTETIRATNKRLASWARDTPRVTFLECGHLFLEPTSQDAFGFPGRGARNSKGGKAPSGPPISWRLLPDGLHPGPEGMEVLAGCLAPVLRKHLRKPQLLF